MIVTDRAEASLRWANNSMTTNGVSMSRSTSVISIVRDGDKASCRVGADQRGRPGDHRRRGRGQRGCGSVRARGARQCAVDHRFGRRRTTGTRRCRPPAPRCSALWQRHFRVGSADRTRCTATPATKWRRHSWPRSTGLRRRFTQPTGSVEINAKRDGASAWAGVSTPDFLDVPTDRLLADLSTRLGWSRRTVSLPAGRYPTLMPPSTVADMMIYMAWMMDGRGAQEGPHDVLRAGRRDPGGGAAHPVAGDAVLGSIRAAVAVPAVRGDIAVRRRRCRCSTTAWTSTASTGSVTG